MDVQVRSLRKDFMVGGTALRAVDDVSFHIASGQTLGLVGESGSGKTTVGRCILRLTDATSGEILVGDTNVGTLSQAQLRKWRAHNQMVFQDPYGSLNPRMRIEALLSEPLQLHTDLDAAGRQRRSRELTDMVRLEAKHLDRFPHELSGGQLQRVGIARTLATSPKFIVLDEPTSSLDLSVRAGILRLLRSLQGELGLTYLLISHDLQTVAAYCDSVAVMYLGAVVESGPTRDVFAHPEHPYTQALLSASLPPNPRAKLQRILLQGEMPSPLNVPSGCRFRSRCPLARAECTLGRPEFRLTTPEHRVACVRVDDATNHIAAFTSTSAAS